MIKLSGDNLTIDKYRQIVFGNEKISITDSARNNVDRARQIIDSIVESNEKVYGVTTGFGKLVDVSIPPDRLKLLQKNIIRSHSAGTGSPFDYETVRGAMLLRINTVIRGNSGLSPKTLNTYIEMVNNGLYPYVPSKGSVGASGDLAPLSHIALAAMGEGEFIENGKRKPALEVLDRYSIEPIDPLPKEGLCLVNGTQFMTALGANAMIRGRSILKTADIAAAVSVDGLLGSIKQFAGNIQLSRNQIGQQDSAANIRAILKGSSINESHKGCGRVQDPYSIRCSPQVHGAVRDAYDYAFNIIEREMNSSTDNPLVFSDSGEVVSGGNFHGETIAIPLDTMKIAFSELANISDRRLYLLMDSRKTGLEPFLAHEPGINSGFMMLQVTTASLVSENKVLSHPSSVDSIPTSSGQEDHVSMGTISGRHLMEILGNVETVLGIELLAGINAVKMREPLLSSPPIEALKSVIMKDIEQVTADRPFYRDIDAIRRMIADNSV
ncbi:MAG: histidine ammonia-lyase, partial [candidate division WOR-3 bacterium]|nr:histidine ammonia-lyase [candidate division WOR-3 bacterium]